MSLVYVTSAAGSVEAYSATITRPLRGVWHAHLEVDSTVSLTGAVTIGVAEGALELVGRVTAGAIIHERQAIRVVGGAAGLSKSLPARSYARSPLRVPLTDVLTASGERLASSSDAAALGTVLTRWTRTEGPASGALEQLVARVPGTIWRVTASGAVWVGTNAWPAVSLEYVTIEDDPARRVMIIASDDPTLSAGVTLDGRRLEHVVHRFASSGTRMEIHYS